MSGFRPRKTKLGGLPNISFVIRKPCPLGTEFKDLDSTVTSVITYLEIQQGKMPTRKALYPKDYGTTAARILRMMEGRTQETKKEKELVLVDSWFGSAQAASQLGVRGFDAILCVSTLILLYHMYTFVTHIITCILYFQIKTNHSLFPKKFIEEHLKDAPGGVHIVLTGKAPNEVSLMAVGYKYSKRNVLNFMCTQTAGHTRPGTPYEMKFTDAHGNVCVRYVKRP